MNFILGLIVASGAIWFSLSHLDQYVNNYWDFVAFAMVVGGTLAVALVIFPWAHYRTLFTYGRKLFFNVSSNRRAFITICFQSVSEYRNRGRVDSLSPQTFEEKLLLEGFELLRLGVRKDKVESILNERLYQYKSRGESVYNSFRSLAKYPPAFGLTGTVFGLVELMKGVSQGLPAKETGVKMAIALVATMYGLLLANLVVNPAGEQIKKIVEGEIQIAEIAIQTILMASEDVSMVEVQEMLNSMVHPSHRISSLENLLSTEEAV